MLRALIVDDERIERAGIAMLLTRMNLPIVCSDASDGEEALRLLENEHYDLLFTDIHMPFMDGLDLAHEARSRFPNLVTIIFTAYGDFPKAQRAIRDHVFAYLLKPVCIPEFQETVEKAIVHIRSQNQRRDEQRRLIEDTGAEEGSPASTATSQHAAVGKVIGMIHEEYMTNLTLSVAARRVYLTASYLSTLFSRETGQTFVRYLNDYRLEKASEWLVGSNMQIQQIAARAGFSSQSYFIAQFRERYHMTPQQYRLQASELAPQ